MPRMTEEERIASYRAKAEAAERRLAIRMTPELQALEKARRLIGKVHAQADPLTEHELRQLDEAECTILSIVHVVAERIAAKMRDGEVGDGN